MKKLFAALLLTGLSAMASATPGATTDFSDGLQGWNSGPAYDGTQGAWIDSSLSTSPVLHTVNPLGFGMSWSNTTNPAFTGNFGTVPSMTISIDVLANSITYLGSEVTRQLVIEMRDYDNPYKDMPYTSVWYSLGAIGAGMGWRHLSVTIDDTGSAVLPGGWGGYGIDDTETDGVPGLPPGRSFADVLASVDELVFSTYVPGYFYGYASYDIAVDNMSLVAAGEVPEPGSLALLLGGIAMAGLARRRQMRGANLS
jgi:hypothetical protein